MKIKQAFSILLLSACSVNIYAAVWQSHTSIKEKANAFLKSQLSITAGQRLEVQVNPLDKRLKLERCKTPLKASLPYGTKNRSTTSVAIHCESGNTWKIYVTARVKRMGKTYISQSFIRKGEIISANDLRSSESDLNLIRSAYFTRKNDIIGKVAKRNIPAERMITPMMIGNPQLVRKGDRVTLLAVKRGIEVRMQGEAITAGGSGDHIRVRALTSKRIVEGKVISPGIIQVSFL
ncbi:MAG: flagellar basal body P-ring formation protein FlgA [Gammaproteobacteria bacterium]|nr:flagellar basal body P-ring formation protein FlgA [Gammaproteobacteria bacterium]